MIVGTCHVVGRGYMVAIWVTKQESTSWEKLSKVFNTNGLGGRSAEI
jgi:hypothetical protein